MLKRISRALLREGIRTAVLFVLVTLAMFALLNLAPGDPVALYEAGKQNHTPILIGSNANEGALFPTAKTAEAYRAARAAPELIEQMPCYCGCSKTEGHLNNLDCYVDRHAAT